MRKLLGLVIVLAVLVGVAELLAPPWVAARAEQKVEAESEGRVAVDIDVSGPPLLIPVAVSGEVESWTMRLSRVGGREIPLEVYVDLEQVTLDRSRLVRGDVVVTDVDRARVSVRADLSDSVPPALQPMADRLADVGLERLLEAVGGQVVAQQGGALLVGDLSLPLVEGSCQVSSDDLVVTTHCDLAEVPSFLVAAFD